MIDYCLGFMFDQNCHRVVLIKKTHPDWQKGRYNGVGGVLEDTEMPVSGMVRKFKAETGMESSENDWQRFCEIKEWKKYNCHCFKAQHFALPVETKTDEIVDIIPIRRILMGTPDNPGQFIPNLQWLIPMAICSQIHQSAEIWY